jgi:enoyl-CoA hydratase
VSAVREETRGAARLVVLCRPEKRNALSADAAAALAAAVERAASDASIRGIVIAAEGPVFAAGGDLSEFAALVDQGEAGAEAVLEMGRRMRGIERAPVPVVAAVGGDVFGGGCELLLLCDAVFVERAVKLVFRHAEMGLCPAWGASARLIERVGPLAATRLLAAAEPITGDEAAAMGLASEAVDAGGALDRALVFVERIARLDRAAVAAQKGLLHDVRAAMRADAELREATLFKSLWGGPAHRSAMQAFAQRARASAPPPPGRSDPR